MSLQLPAKTYMTLKSSYLLSSSQQEIHRTLSSRFHLTCTWRLAIIGTLSLYTWLSSHHISSAPLSKRYTGHCPRGPTSTLSGKYRLGNWWIRGAYRQYARPTSFTPPPFSITYTQTGLEVIEQPLRPTRRSSGPGSPMVGHNRITLCQNRPPFWWHLH